MTGAERPAQQPDEAVNRLAEDIAAVGRQEVDRVRRQGAEALRGAGAGTALMAGAGACALMGAAAGWVASLRALESVMPPRRAAALLAVGYLGAAAALAAVGLDRLNAAGGASQQLAGQVRARLRRTARQLGRQRYR